ncbi:MAG: PRD domain-containing protein [Clostridiaceae bacterium]|nr:PRD domain-containing protein [Clostridiaceae bacterium]
MSGKKRYRIKKVMNNNVILAVDLQSNLEMVLLGKGIGFGKKENMVVGLDPDRIEKSFHTVDKKIEKNYLMFLSQINENVLDAVEEIISMAEQSLGKLSEQLQVVLTDHIKFALERIKMGIVIDNPFLHEIKVLYSKEFEIGKKSAEIIKVHTGIQISEEEMGFIALYLYSARQNKTINETVKDTRILRELVEIIEKELNYKINPEDMAYNRLVNHLMLEITSVMDSKNTKNPLLKHIKDEMPLSFAIAKKLANHLQKNKNVIISEDKAGYMAIHIERIRELAEADSSA